MMFRVEMNQISKNFTQVTSTLTPATFFLAINMTIIIAIIGSAIPAWFIARISPAEILRSE
jgi:ABC-type antimicrobial peptide transport system permease subunit